MLCHNVVGVYRSNAISIGKFWTNATSVSKENMDFWSWMVSAAWTHARSFACALNSSIKVGGCISSPWLSMCLPVCSLSGRSWSRYSVSTSCCSLVSLMMSTGNFSSGLGLSVPSLLILESVSGAWCLTPARWTTSKSNSSRRNRHLADLPEASADVSNYFRDS